MSATTPCYAYGCKDDAAPNTDPPRCAAHALRPGRTGAPIPRRTCPRGCEGGICKAATVRVGPGGWTLVTAPAPGECAMFGGPVPAQEGRQVA